MPITLGSNIASMRGQRQLAKTSHELGAVFQRLSSGQRINKASDDAAGLSIADSLNARSRIYNQGIRNLNDGQSLLSISYSVGSGPQHVSTGDFNGDGFLDLVTADLADFTATVLLGLGNGSLAPSSTLQVGSSPTSVATADFNGDGVMDLATADLASNTASVLLGHTKDGAGPLLRYNQKLWMRS
jgi:hypothetical protein